jgi:hypothetical protein
MSLAEQKLALAILILFVEVWQQRIHHMTQGFQVEHPVSLEAIHFYQWHHQTQEFPLELWAKFPYQLPPIEKEAS